MLVGKFSLFNTIMWPALTSLSTNCEHSALKSRHDTFNLDSLPDTLVITQAYFRL